MITTQDSPLSPHYLRTMTISNDKTVFQLYLIRVAHSPCKSNRLEYGVIRAAAILYGNTQPLRPILLSLLVVREASTIRLFCWNIVIFLSVAKSIGLQLQGIRSLSRSSLVACSFETLCRGQPTDLSATQDQVASPCSVLRPAQVSFIVAYQEKYFLRISSYTAR